MTQRLPTPGGDSGSWGDILNAYLEVSLNSDGTLANNTVGTSQIQSGAVTNAQLDSPTQTTLASVAGKYTKPGGGIPSTDMTSAIQTSLGLANTSVQSVNSITPTSGNVTITAGSINAIPTSQLGTASGVATLDGTGNVPSSQLSNATGSSVPTPSATNQTIVSNGSNVWTLTPAATLDTTDTPQPDTVLGNPGTGPKAATANHSHPLNTLGRSMFFGGYPPSLSDNTDFTFDGTWNGTIPSSGASGGFTTLPVQYTGWNLQYQFDCAFTPVQCQAVRLVMQAASSGNDPDSITYGNGGAPRTMLRFVGVYSVSSQTNVSILV